MSDKIKHSEPISIPNNQHSHSRARSVSFSPSSSSEDESNSPPLRTPTSPGPQPRVNTTAQPKLSPSTSPLLSYFLSSPPKGGAPQSPSTGFNSLGRGFASKPQEPIIEEGGEDESPIVRHARRMSTSAGWPPGAPRFNAGTTPATTSEHHERGASLLRRLSLGSALVRPQIPTASAPPPTPSSANPANAHTNSPPRMNQSTSASSDRRKRRATTMASSDGTRPRRAPSPMGERILKGHFDGFN
ncbi:hypothetical protein M0805_007594 [Coniferiporia weirii]|nr:hypothetical protein M0805_007594 [Coniferiporia weirii]